MKTVIFLSFLSLYSNFLAAQRHDQIWVTDTEGLLGFEGANMLDFSMNVVSISEGDLNLNTNISLVSMCDEEGNLIFYSNNIKMMNVDFELMVNGDSIVTGFLAEDFEDSGYPELDNIFVLPQPNYNQSYYVIYRLKEFGSLNLAPKLLYSKIDMNLDNGKGAVSEKEQLIAETVSFDSPSALKHANGRDWWVLAPYWHIAKTFRFLLTPEGIQDTVTFDLGYQKPSFPEENDGGGQNVFSPDGTKYVDYDYYNGIRIFDFDRCTGELSNPIIISHNNPLFSGFGCQISPNSRYLYTCFVDTIFQYDLHAINITASKTVVAAYDGFDWMGQTTSFYSMQTMPDGKIYIVPVGGNIYMHYIDQPNQMGLNCNVIQHGLELPNQFVASKPHFPNYRLGPIDGSPCDTLGIDNLPVAKYRHDQDTLDELKVYFTDLSYYEPATWHWDFDDNATSTDTCPVHTFPAPGIYEVCLTVSNNNLPAGDMYCQTLQLGTVGTAATPHFETKLFPNPCREMTTLFVYDYLPQDATITLRDAVGREVFRQRAFFGANRLKLGHLPKGVYLYEVREKHKIVTSGKLVRQ